MIYARAHDQTVADDYFAAMQRVEQRLEIMLAPKEVAKPETEYVCESKPGQVPVWLESLTLPELCQAERFEIAKQLKQTLFLGFADPISPPVMASVG